MLRRFVQADVARIGQSGKGGGRKGIARESDGRDGHRSRERGRAAKRLVLATPVLLLIGPPRL
eukprot:CAMPEP_0171110922 /NCGR_PEP_ID=MMETSP0766_2-20121228/73029_1 /TAXON_ID=439317 /ORGANISM="Gambierdiscus australes, Strain CAWD 149" /LENGTH=62 /DNA_ID=CAMNT_0011572849 /DNA_START=97 /DNA_END=283 /DNA_ORIENTATION=+